MVMIELMLTTNPGVEDLLAEEVSLKLRAHITMIKHNYGRVFTRIHEDYLYALDYLRGMNKAYLVLGRDQVCPRRSCLKEIYNLVHSTSIHEYTSKLDKFAVRVERVGNHEYTSLDIAKVVGDAVRDSVRNKKGHDIRVDLDYPSFVVSINVIEDEILILLELGEFSRHQRGYRIYEHPASLSPVLAYALLILSNVRDSELILDPMCGGGTIAIEAALLLENAGIYCMDKSVKHINGAEINAKAALVHNRIRFLIGDATNLSYYFKTVDNVITNPPYGIRLGRPSLIRPLYQKFVSSLAKIVRKKVAIITTEYQFLEEQLSKAGWAIVHTRRVMHGNLYPHIVIAEPT